MRKAFLLAFLLLLGGWSIVGAHGWPPPVGEGLKPVGEGKGLLARRLPSQTLIDSTHSYDVLHYRLDIRFPMTSGYIEGSATIACRSQVNGLDSLSLNCVDLTVDQVIRDGVAVLSSWSQNASHLIIHDLDTAFSAGDSFDVEVAYHGEPSFGYYFVPVYDWMPDTTAFTFTEPSDSRHWFPCFDEPWDKADSGCQINATVPLGFQVASNGLLTEVDTAWAKPRPTVTYRWVETHAIATYLMSVAISKFAILLDQYVNGEGDTILVQHFVYHPDSAAAVGNFASVVDIMAYFSSRFGEYPFDKYGMAAIHPFGGGMEHQTMTTMGRWVALDSGSEGIIAHELAHQWWGDMITCANWPSIWLNEGFASYADVLWTEHHYGRAPFLARMEDYADGYFDQDESRRFPIYDPPPGQLFNWGITYCKGAWVLHMLRWVVGDEVFWDIFPAYADAYRSGNATIPEFKDVCEDVWGEDLDWFFDQWIYEPGHPEYDLIWVVEGSGDRAYKNTVIVHQVQEDAPLFRMPVELSLVTPDSVVTHRVTIDDAVETFQFITTSEPTEVALDPNYWILKEVTTVTTPLISYQDHSVNDDLGDGDGVADPGELVGLVVTVFNEGAPATDVTASLQTEDRFITVVEGTSSFVDMGAWESGDNASDPFSFSVDSSSLSHVATFILHVSADAGYEAIDTLRVDIGPTMVLLVDDDDGGTYETYYRASLAKVVPFDEWEVATQGVPEHLADYHSVVWFTGDDSTSTLAAEEQARVALFLQEGGNLFISGQDIGLDLVENGTVQDSAFYGNYLRASYIFDNAAQGFPGVPMMRGVNGDTITDQFSLVWICDEGGADNQDSPSVIDVVGDDVFIIFNYVWTPPGIPEHGAALRYDGAYRLIYLAFGFEAVNDLGDRDNLMERAIGWFEGFTGVEESGDGYVVMPRRPHLSQNYPNPFNPTTEIRYALPEAGHVTVEIYNILGQRVVTLVDAFQGPGYRTVRWEGVGPGGKEVASGVYFCRLQARDVVQTRRMVLLR